MVPKWILNELWVSMLMLHAEAPYFKEKTMELEDMEAKLEMLFSLILRDETPEDRVPGVPRII